MHTLAFNLFYTNIAILSVATCARCKTSTIYISRKPTSSLLCGHPNPTIISFLQDAFDFSYTSPACSVAFSLRTEPSMGPM